MNEGHAPPRITAILLLPNQSEFIARCAPSTRLLSTYTLESWEALPMMFRERKMPEHLTEEDLHELVAAGVPEGTTIDYKRSFSEEKKTDLADDVAAFANGSGGWVFVGIDERDSIPTAIPGVECTGIDKRIRQLEQMLEGNIEPRVPGVRIAAVPLASGRYVFAIRVEESLRGPHLVKSGEGYVGKVRGSKGNNRLDVEGLRERFLGAEALPDKLRRFRSERVRDIAGGTVTVHFGPRPLVILHALPFASVGHHPPVDIHQELPPVDRRASWAKSFFTSRYNLEGRLFYDADEGFLQVFRTGALEFVYAYAKEPKPSIRPTIDKFLCDQVSYLLAQMSRLSVPPPVSIFLTLVGFHGSSVASDPSYAWNHFYGGSEIDRAELFFPDVLVTSLDENPMVFFRPILDMLWNAMGFAHSPNFGPDGDWARKEWRSDHP